jgi:hypothetical protein
VFESSWHDNIIVAASSPLGVVSALSGELSGPIAAGAGFEYNTVRSACRRACVLGEPTSLGACAFEQ